MFNFVNTIFKLFIIWENPVARNSEHHVNIMGNIGNVMFDILNIMFVIWNIMFQIVNRMYQLRSHHATFINHIKHVKFHQMQIYYLLKLKKIKKYFVKYITIYLLVIN